MTNNKKATIDCGFFVCNIMGAAALADAVAAAVNEYVWYYGDNDGSDDNGDDEALVAALENVDEDEAAAVATVKSLLPVQAACLQWLLIQQVQFLYIS